jgi:signal peptidase I
MATEPHPQSAPEPAGDAVAAPGSDKKPESWWETLRFFLLLFLAALVVRSFVVAPFSIPSGSMLPRLMIGDYLFVSKWSYGFSRYSLPFGLINFQGRIFSSLPARGDVVVFRYPDGSDEDFVKRVIGLPGDTIEVRAGVVRLNGAELPRQRIADYAMPITPNSPCRAVAQGSARRLPGPEGQTLCAYPRYRETLPDGRSYDVLDQIVDAEADTFGPIMVPEGQLFVMGDNRDDSMDSRFSVQRGGVGLLPVENLLGRVMVTFWSTDGSAEWVKPWTWFSAARWDRIGQTGE